MNIQISAVTISWQPALLSQDCWHSHEDFLWRKNYYKTGDGFPLDLELCVYYKYPETYWMWVCPNYSDKWQMFYLHPNTKQLLSILERFAASWVLYGIQKVSVSTIFYLWTKSPNMLATTGCWSNIAYLGK